MKIIFYVAEGGPGAWDSRNIEQGIGGSEESLIYVSKYLVKLGHEVIVYNGREHVYNDEFGVEWVPHTRPLDTCDIFIAFRQWQFTELSTGKRTYLIEQDHPVEPHFSPEAKARVERGEFRMILLNEHHRNQYGIAPEHAFVCSNGCEVSQFDQAVERIPGKCIYFSHPHRGLVQLRECWPKIREAVPHATLHAFWWEPEVFFSPNEAIGIMPMRSLGHSELAREILSSDLFTYPSIFHPEISPVSCIKAQVGGAWPVTVNCGGMADTLLFDIGNGTQETYAERVIAATCSNEHEMTLKEKARSNITQKAREHFDWKNIALRWEADFETELLKHE